MIEKIIESSARNKFLTFLLTGFLIAGGIWAMNNIPMDAIPDLSDVQVIVFTEWKGRSPDLVEDQITYPIVTTLLAAPKVKVVRGYSFFGLSFVYVLFEEGTDIYWARSRVLEYMQSVSGQLPSGVTPTLGPDATGVGWGFQYVLVDRSGKHTLQEIRSFQDWYLRYWLQSVEGVSEVASVGGYEKQYQVELDPNKLLAYHLSVQDVIERIRQNNNDVGGRVFEFTGREYFVRGRGYIQDIRDIEEIALGVNPDGTPVLLRDVATVHLGPDIRRGAAEFNGEGEVVGGIVIVRFGEDVQKVIERVKKKIEEVKPGFLEGLELIPVYDRSELIERSIDTLKHKLIEEMVVVAFVIIVFLWHFRSAFIPIVILPIAVLISFIPMIWLNLSFNIMSLGGIAIAIGAMVDAAIILIENAHKRIERWKEEGRKENYADVLIDSAREVGRPLFFSLLVIAVSFLPIFTLEAQEGRLFKPLAFTKTFAMAFAAFLSITLAPALMTIFIRERRFHLKPLWFNRIVTFFAGGDIHAEEHHPVSRILFRFYTPVVHWVLDHRKGVIAGAILLMLSTIPVYLSLGSEFMPPLNEGAILYMPTTLPGISITEAKKMLQAQDKILKGFPEVETVFGKVGRAKTSTDPAPLSMVETTVVLKSQKEWRKVKDKLFGFIPWRRRITWEELIDEMDRALKFPGVTNAWTMPIKGRIDMLTTGIRTPIGVKIFGADLKEIEKIGKHLEMILQKVPGTRSVYSERVTGGYFLDVIPIREEVARYNLTVEDVEYLVETAIGGMSIDHTIEGRERYTINVRYARELRDSIDKLKKVLVLTPMGVQVPLGQLATIRMRTGPPSIKDEDGSLTGWVYVDVAGRDIGSYVKEAQKGVEEQLTLPAGYHLVWTGQYEFMQRATKRLRVVVPITLFIIFVLLYLNTKSIVRTFIVLLAVPFSLIGAFWLLWLLQYNLSIAVWVGIIALAGVDAETGVVMLLYLDLAYEEAKRKGNLRNFGDLREAIVHGAVKRVRPKLMTASVLFMGLLPIMWAASWEAGADVMKRIAAPMVGGIFTSFLLELIVYPALYAVWKWRFEMKEGKAAWILAQGIQE